MYRAAAVGSYESIYGFLAAGIEIFAVKSESECVDVLKKIASDDYGTVFVTEDFAYIPEVRALFSKPLPAILVIPSVQGSNGKAVKELHEMVEKAAGADLLR